MLQANSGIGLATATGLARRKMTVLMVCRNKERGSKAVRDVRAATANENVHLHVLDVSDFEAVRAWGKVRCSVEGGCECVCVCVCVRVVYSPHTPTERRFGEERGGVSVQRIALHALELLVATS